MVPVWKIRRLRCGHLCVNLFYSQHWQWWLTQFRMLLPSTMRAPSLIAWGKNTMVPAPVLSPRTCWENLEQFCGSGCFPFPRTQRQRLPRELFPDASHSPAPRSAYHKQRRINQFLLPLCLCCLTFQPLHLVWLSKRGMNTIEHMLQIHYHPSLCSLQPSTTNCFQRKCCRLLTTAEAARVKGPW